MKLAGRQEMLERRGLTHGCGVIRRRRRPTRRQRFGASACSSWSGSASSRRGASCSPLLTTNSGQAGPRGDPDLVGARRGRAHTRPNPVRSGARCPQTMSRSNPRGSPRVPSRPDRATTRRSSPSPASTFPHHEPLEAERLLHGLLHRLAMRGLRAQRAHAPRHLARRGLAAVEQRPQPERRLTGLPERRPARDRARNVQAPPAATRRAHGGARASWNSAPARVARSRPASSARPAHGRPPAARSCHGPSSVRHTRSIDAGGARLQQP